MWIVFCRRRVGLSSVLAGEDTVSNLQFHLVHFQCCKIAPIDNLSGFIASRGASTAEGRKVADGGRRLVETRGAAASVEAVQRCTLRWWWRQVTGSFQSYRRSTTTTRGSRWA